MTQLKFRIEQIALAPANTGRAIKLLSDLGLTDWFKDNVVASGHVYGVPGQNSALLQFNYQAGNGNDPAGKPLELEVLKYVDGNNWLNYRPDNTTSHLGMHVTSEELYAFQKYFEREGIPVAQAVWTDAHTNPAIAGKRFYNYVIFDTHQIIGVDLKFIVRHDVTQVEQKESRLHRNGEITSNVKVEIDTKDIDRAVKRALSAKKTVAKPAKPVGRKTAVRSK
jgi:hypothetical protein